MASRLPMSTTDGARWAAESKARDGLRCSGDANARDATGRIPTHCGPDPVQDLFFFLLVARDKEKGRVPSRPNASQAPSGEPVRRMFPVREPRSLHDTTRSEN